MAIDALLTMHIIELRSDTHTRPTPGMREAMATAEVGDDMNGEDPTVNRLEARLAEMFGTEAAVFACSGTQSNQMGVWTHCQRGDELLIESTGHIGNYEAGGPAVLSGASVRFIQGDAGRLDVCHLEGKLRPLNQHFSPTKLLCLENSTNLGGGRTYSLAHLERVCNWAHEQGLKTHLDGARIFNACIVNGYAPADVGRCFDTISVCFSKGLGCPMGSMLVGSREEIARARRARKVFGGALRQAGIPAAACLYALEHHLDRLAEDHRLARRLAQGIAEIPGVRIDIETVETNLVFFEIAPEFGTAAQFSVALRGRGLHMNPSGGPQRLRAVTHLDVTEEQIQRAVEIIRETLPTLRQTSPPSAVTAAY